MVARVRVRDRVRDWDDIEFQKLCRKIQLSLMERNLEKAHDQVSAFARTMDGSKRPQLELGDSVSLLLDPESAGLLQGEGYDTIASILYATDDELLRIHMFGQKRLAKARAALVEHKFASTKKSGVLTAN